ncbi:Modification methylase HphIA (plasmid) [Euzebya pacifica]|uniref:DNA (cytosine-5-)-methyltransferase n=2 Tax=Euzebya pacifica TaxID=1608957 RepID=A0A346Y6T3_9ACTN|nr:Modification methylase HphIA [Euzebya pacifica]
MAAATYSANHTATDPISDWRTAGDHAARPIIEQLDTGICLAGVEEVVADPDAVAWLAAADIDAIVGGPPCQGFSMNGTRTDGDPRDTLVWPMLQLVERLAPRFVVIENVEGMAAAKGDGKAVFDAAGEHLAALGYAVQPCTVDAAHYAVPQSRRRLLLIADLGRPAGVREPFDSGDATGLLAPPDLFPVPTTPHRPITVAEALFDIDCDGYTTGPDDLGVYGSNVAGRWRAARRAGRTDPLPNHELTRHSPTVVQRYRLLLAVHAAGLDPRLIPAAAKANDPSLLAPYDTLSVAGVCQPGETVAEAAWRLRSRKRTQRVWDPDKPAPTLGTQSQDWIHPTAPRNPSPREMARLQSFPDGYLLRGKVHTGGLKRRVETPTLTQVGNAVPPLLGEAIGKCLAAAVTAACLPLAA